VTQLGHDRSPFSSLVTVKVEPGSTTAIEPGPRVISYG
jgi:hypothetical protein